MAPPQEQTDVIFEIGKGPVDDARQVITDLGLRPYRTFLVVEVYPGPRVRQGTRLARKWAEILPSPRVRAYRAPLSGANVGATLEGTVILDRISRSRFTREDLRGLTVTSAPLANEESIYYALVPRGQREAQFYRATAEPLLRAFGWSVLIAPVKRRAELPEL